MSARQGGTLRVAVVGHTNAGKTSLLRTLLRDVDFGEVSDSPGTTREVSGASITVDGRSVIELYDTPGLEDSIQLLETLESLREGHRADGPTLIERFLERGGGGGPFAQEAKSLRQILGCDAALYVVDARDPVLARYADELRILGYCARPVIPVLNFVASVDANTEQWRRALARANMHAVAEFDTVVLEAAGERRLLEKMQTLLDPFRSSIDALIRRRQRERDELIDASAGVAAEMLVDVAAFSIEVTLGDPARIEHATAELRECIRRREQRSAADMLELHRFRPDDYIASPLPMERGEWGHDLFSKEAMQEYGLRGGGGAAAGAMVGLTLDVLLHGLSLGAGTAIGAAVGGAVGAGQLPGKRLLERLRGKARLRADRGTWRILLGRQIDLIHALLHRGHAGREPIRLTTPAFDEALRPMIKDVTAILRRCAGRREWSRLRCDDAREPDGASHPVTGSAFLPDARRGRSVAELTARIAAMIRSVNT